MFHEVIRQGVEVRGDRDKPSGFAETSLNRFALDGDQPSHGLIGACDDHFEDCGLELADTRVPRGARSTDRRQRPTSRSKRSRIELISPGVSMPRRSETRRWREMARLCSIRA